MIPFKSKFLQELHMRGFIYQGTHLEVLDNLANQKSITLYVGYDATARSLHVGNLMTIMLMRIAERHGHKPLILLGGGTTKVGDPSGKDTQRQLLGVDHIQDNVSSIKKVFNRYLNVGATTELLNNDTWLSNLNYLEFLRDYGKYFTLNRMLTFDSVKLRLEREQPLTFLEFNYMILQGYDFLHLFREKNCILQIGGSDQWGNIINGIDLIHKAVQKDAYGLTIPLITTSSGAKMGKTAGGAVWLDSELLSPFDYWQFWRNTEDADVVRFMSYFTDIPVEELQEYKNISGEGLNPLKKRLADEATQLAHGKDILMDIHASVQSLFENQKGGIEIMGQDFKGNFLLKSALPIVQLPREEMMRGVLLIDVLIRLDFATSKGEARRLIQGGGCRVNDEKMLDEAYHLQLKDLQDPGVIKISAGKKKHGYVQGVL